MFALYKREDNGNCKFIRTVTLGGILAGHLTSEAERKQPDPNGRMDWEISCLELRRLVMKQFSTPSEIREEDKFKLIIDATYRQDYALLFEIYQVWGFADPDWSPVLLRLCQLCKEDIKRVHGPNTPVECFEPSTGPHEVSEFVHEFLYLNWGHHGGKQRNWGTVGYTNAALLWPPHLKHLLGEIGFMEKPAEDRFVLFNIGCKCGTKLMVHGEYYVGTRGGSQSVRCPKCNAEHYLPTRPLRFFYEESGYWKPVSA